MPKYHDSGTVCNAKVRSCPLGLKDEDHIVAPNRKAFEKLLAEKMGDAAVTVTVEKTIVKQTPKRGIRELNQLAKTSTDVEILDEAADSTNANVLKSLAGNPAATEEQLIRAYANAADSLTKTAIAGNSNFPMEKVDDDKTFLKYLDISPSLMERNKPRPRWKQTDENLGDKELKFIEDNLTTRQYYYPNLKNLAVVAGNPKNKVSAETVERLLKENKIDIATAWRSGKLPIKNFKNLNEAQMHQLIGSYSLNIDTYGEEGRKVFLDYVDKHPENSNDSRTTSGRILMALSTKAASPKELEEVTKRIVTLKDRDWFLERQVEDIWKNPLANDKTKSWCEKASPVIRSKIKVDKLKKDLGQDNLYEFFKDSSRDPYVDAHGGWGGRPSWGSSTTYLDVAKIKKYNLDENDIAQIYPRRGQGYDIDLERGVLNQSWDTGD